MSYFSFIAGSGSGESDLALSYKAVCDKAYRSGQEVRVPTSSELFLDIDTKQQFHHFLETLPKVASNEGKKFLRFVTTPSKDCGDHYHIVVEMEREVSNLERIALQAILGSDPVREIIALRRVRAGNETPTVFFESMQ